MISLNLMIDPLLHRLYDTAIRLGELQAGYNLQIDPEEYAQENLKFGLVEVVYEWAKVCNQMIALFLVTLRNSRILLNEVYA